MSGIILDLLHSESSAVFTITFSLGANLIDEDTGPELAPGHTAKGSYLALV